MVRKSGGGSGNAVSLATAVPNVFFTINSDTQVSLRWANRPVNNRTAVNVYVSETQTLSTSTPTFVLGDINVKVLTGLTAGTTYWVYVENEYNIGKSEKTMVSFTTTGSPPPASPIVALPL